MASYFELFKPTDIFFVLIQIRDQTAFILILIRCILCKLTAAVFMNHKMVATSVIPKVKLLTCVSLCSETAQALFVTHAVPSLISCALERVCQRVKTMVLGVFAAEWFFRWIDVLGNPNKQYTCSIHSNAGFPKAEYFITCSQNHTQIIDNNIKKAGVI